MQSMANGFNNTYTDLSTWIVPLGALVLVMCCMAAAVSWRLLMTHWVSGLLAVSGAASAMAIVKSIYDRFHS